MSSCSKKILCAYYHNRFQINSSDYDYNKKKYCEGDYQKCARYIVFEKIGFMKVTNDLLPHQIEKAEKICSNG